MSNQEVCKLCHNQNKLQNSHIIPEFCFSPLYDDLHRFHVLSADRFKKNKLAQKGLREKLLCRDCEQIFARWEKYAASAMAGKASIKLRNHAQHFSLSGIKYKPFKLYALSILWRCSVSNDPFCSMVSLGPHEEKLRNMLINEDPGPEDIYPFCIIFTSYKGQDTSDIIINPAQVRFGGARCYRFLFAGAAWIFHVDARQPNPHFKKTMLKADGSLIALKIDLHELGWYEEMGKAYLIKAPGIM